VELVNKKKKSTALSVMKGSVTQSRGTLWTNRKDSLELSLNLKKLYGTVKEWNSAMDSKNAD
jgi:hypothetical protein